MITRQTTITGVHTGRCGQATITIEAKVEGAGDAVSCVDGKLIRTIRDYLQASGAVHVRVNGITTSNEGEACEAWENELRK